MHDMPMGANGRGTMAQSGQRNDGVTATKTQRLHQRLGYINRTLQADIAKPTSLEKNINNLQKLNIYIVMKKNLILLKKICI